MSNSYETHSIVEDSTAGETLDSLMLLVSEMLPVDHLQYPEVPRDNQSKTITFCLQHSALHFSKTAGRLAAFVEDADHGHFARIQTLEGIVAAGLVNSLKLADEIGLSGTEIMEAVRSKFDSPAARVLRT